MDNTTALMAVAEKGHTKTVEMLLSKVAHVNAKAKEYYRTRKRKKYPKCGNVF